jgi:sterol desaturase/sphingolipid hydroxylase (fatty acid hydroxylase superfamily)
MSQPPQRPSVTNARWMQRKMFPWIGFAWIVIGAAMVGVWAWGWAQGDLSAPAASDRFVAWSELAIGIIFVGLGITWTVVIRRERRREAS